MYTIPRVRSSSLLTDSNLSNGAAVRGITSSCGFSNLLEIYIDGF